MKVVQCYELFGGIALKKSRVFIFFLILPVLHLVYGSHSNEALSIIVLVSVV